MPTPYENPKYNIGMNKTAIRNFESATLPQIFEYYEETLQSQTNIYHAKFDTHTIGYFREKKTHSKVLHLMSRLSVAFIDSI